MKGTPRADKSQDEPTSLDTVLIRIFEAPEEPEPSSPQKIAKLHAARWFGPWIRHHVGTCCHKAWKEPEYNPATAKGRKWLQGWILNFIELQVSKEEAYEASRRLQVKDYGFPEQQMRAVCDLIRSQRKEKVMSVAPDSKAERIRREQEELKYHERAKARWKLLTPAQRQARIDAVNEENPTFRQIPKMAELFAIQTIAEAIAEKAAKTEATQGATA